MKLNINNKNYILKYNLLSRIKLSQKFESEESMLNLIQQQDYETLIIFVKNCIQDYISDEEFLTSYPRAIETQKAFYELALNLINEAINPLGIDEPNIESNKKENTLKIDFKSLLLEIMSKGYTQKEALDMTNWDISLIFKADYKKLEREVIHTNALINTMIAIMGGKEKYDLLGRKETIENFEEKYPLESQALDFFYSIKNKRSNETIDILGRKKK